MQIVVSTEVQTGKTSKSPLNVPTATDDFMRFVQGHFIAKEMETAQHSEQKTLDLDQESNQAENGLDGAVTLAAVETFEPDQAFLIGETSLPKKSPVDQLAGSDSSLEKNARNSTPLPAAFLANGWDAREGIVDRPPRVADQKPAIPTLENTNMLPRISNMPKFGPDAIIALSENSKPDAKLNIEGASKVPSKLLDFNNLPKSDAQLNTTPMTPTGMPIASQAFGMTQAAPLGPMAGPLVTRPVKEPVSSTPKIDPENSPSPQKNRPAPKSDSVGIGSPKNAAEVNGLKSGFMPADIALETIDQVIDEHFGATPVGNDRHPFPLSSSPEVRSATSVHVATVVAQQLAVAVQKNPNGVTELVLNPEELGRVKLAMSTVDGAMTMTITTERPETQDLMRRHIDVLAQELRQMGFSDVGFSFREQGRQESSNSSNETSLAINDLEVEAPMPELTSAETSGLDLRL